MFCRWDGEMRDEERREEKKEKKKKILLFSQIVRIILASWLLGLLELYTQQILAKTRALIVDCRSKLDCFLQSSKGHLSITLIVIEYYPCLFLCILARRRKMWNDFVSSHIVVRLTSTLECLRDCLGNGLLSHRQNGDK